MTEISSSEADTKPYPPYAERVAAARVQHPEWRYGQAAFNCLPAYLQDEVVGTPRDPFYCTDTTGIPRVDDFIAWAVERIAKDGDGEFEPRGTCGSWCNGCDECQPEQEAELPGSRNRNVEQATEHDATCPGYCSKCGGAEQKPLPTTCEFCGHPDAPEQDMGDHMARLCEDPIACYARHDEQVQATEPRCGETCPELPGKTCQLPVGHKGLLHRWRADDSHPTHCEHGTFLQDDHCLACEPRCLPDCEGDCPVCLPPEEYDKLHGKTTYPDRCECVPDEYDCGCSKTTNPEPRTGREMRAYMDGMLDAVGRIDLRKVEDVARVAVEAERKRIEPELQRLRKERDDALNEIKTAELRGAMEAEARIERIIEALDELRCEWQECGSVEAMRLYDRPRPCCDPCGTRIHLLAAIRGGDDE